MNRRKSGLIFFSIIAFLLYVFGIELFESVWSFPEIRKVPLMVIALVGTGIYATVRLGFPQIKYLKHGINVITDLKPYFTTVHIAGGDEMLKMALLNKKVVFMKLIY